MPCLSLDEKQAYKKKYENHKQLIEKRIQNEAASEDPALKKYPTNYNFPTPDGYRLLHLAILAGEPKEVIIDLIQQKGVPINFPKVDGTVSSLSLALQYGEFEIFATLLSLDANITTLFRSDLDLPEAREVYDRLIGEKVIGPAFQNEDSPTGMTFNRSVAKKVPNDLSSRETVNYAAEIGELEFINANYKSHYRFGFNEDEEKINPLLSATENNQLDAIKNIMRYVPIDKKNIKHKSALHVAASLGNWEAAEILFTHNIMISPLRVMNLSQNILIHTISTWSKEAKVGDLLLLKNNDKNEWTLRRFDGLKSNVYKLDEKTAAELTEIINQDAEDKEIKIKNCLCQKQTLDGYQADINKNMQNGKTPLFVAIENGQIDFALKLIARGADVNLETVYGETLWHALACCKSPDKEKISALLNPDQKEQCNIYGETPVAYALRSQSISQSHIFEKIIFYHKLHYRDQDLISKSGYCNGFTFLYQYFHSQKKLDVFYDILNVMVNWDGSESDLENAIAGPSKALFSSKRQLFETIINWLTWYQHNPALASVTGWQQSDRFWQTDVELKYIFSSIKYTGLKRPQLDEIHQILSRLPQHSRIESGAQSHIVGFNVDSDEKNQPTFNYYDSNFAAASVVQPNAEQLSNILLKTKYQMLSGKEEIDFIKLSAYSFASDEIDFSNYRYFDNSEPQRKMPRTADEYEQINRASPNGYTPLHLVCLTNSILDVADLLKLDVDINKKDNHSMAAFDLAIKSNNAELVKMLLNDPRLTLTISDTLLELYLLPETKEAKEIFELILNSGKIKEWDKIFEAAKVKKDSLLMLRLIQEDKISNTCLYKQILAPSFDVYFPNADADVKNDVQSWRKQHKENSKDRFCLLFNDWLELTSSGIKQPDDIDYNTKILLAKLKAIHSEQKITSAYMLYWNEYENSANYNVSFITEPSQIGQTMFPKNIEKLIQEKYKNKNFEEGIDFLIANEKFDWLQMHLIKNRPIAPATLSSLLVKLLDHCNHGNLNGKTPIEQMLMKLFYVVENLPKLNENQWLNLLAVVCQDVNSEKLDKALKADPKADSKNSGINFLSAGLSPIINGRQSIDCAEKLIIHFKDALNETPKELEQSLLCGLFEEYLNSDDDEKSYFYNLIKIAIDNGANVDVEFKKGKLLKDYVIENVEDEQLTALFKPPVHRVFKK